MTEKMRKRKVRANRATSVFRLRKPFILQVQAEGQWFDGERFSNKDEAVARMRNAIKGATALNMRVIRDGYSEDDDFDPRTL
jgi:hypothetical protein